MHQDSKYCNLSNWTKEIHYNTNEKDIAHIPYNRTVLQNSFIYFAFHPEPPLSNCHDLTCQAADSNAVQMQPCNFRTQIQKYTPQTPYVLLKQFMYLIDTFSWRWYIFSSHVQMCFLRLILQKNRADKYWESNSCTAPTLEQFPDSPLPLNNLQTRSYP